MSRKPRKSAAAPVPRTIIQNCTFTNNPASSETVQSIARALEANAQALNALANQMNNHGPMVKIGKD